MEQKQPHSHIHQVQDQLRDGLALDIQQNFNGRRLSVLLDEVIKDGEIEIDTLHKETLRALCHYASVAAGELTNTAVLFVPESRARWASDGYNSKETATTNEFIVVPRSQYTTKNTPTHEQLTWVDLERRSSNERNSK